MRHFPEGFHADRLLRLVAVLAAQNATPRPLASTRLDRKFLAAPRGPRGGAPMIVLAPKRRK